MEPWPLSAPMTTGHAFPDRCTDPPVMTRLRDITALVVGDSEIRLCLLPHNLSVHNWKEVHASRPGELSG